MKIGELARLADVSSHAIRFYERKGLLKAPMRSPAGYRSYSREDLKELRKIHSLKRVGFTLDDILLLARYEAILASDGVPFEARSTAQSQILKRAKERLCELDEQLMRLIGTKKELERMIEAVANSTLRRDFILPTEAALLSGSGSAADLRTRS